MIDLSDIYKSTNFIRFLHSILPKFDEDIRNIDNKNRKYKNIENISNNFKDVNYTNLPLGSKAYKYRKAIAHILPNPYLKISKNCFSTHEEIHQIITQI